MSGDDLPLLRALAWRHPLLQPHHPLCPSLPVIFCLNGFIFSCFSYCVPLQEIHKGDQTIIPSSSCVVLLPPVKTFLEDLFFYLLNIYKACKRETNTDYM